MGLQTPSSWALNSCSHQPPEQFCILRLFSSLALPHSHCLPSLNPWTTSPARRLKKSQFHCEPTRHFCSQSTALCPSYRSSHSPFSHLSHNKANSLNNSLIRHFQIKGDFVFICLSWLLQHAGSVLQTSDGYSRAWKWSFSTDFLSLLSSLGSFHAEWPLQA